jgi:hypothetical protein
MKYVCTATWRDLTDSHLYAAGDEFPHDGREIAEDRLASLAGAQNKAGFALIKAADTPVEENPKATAGTAKKATRSRKKAI